MPPKRSSSSKATAKHADAAAVVESTSSKTKAAAKTQTTTTKTTEAKPSVPELASFVDNNTNAAASIFDSFDESTATTTNKNKKVKQQEENNTNINDIYSKTKSLSELRSLFETETNKIPQIDSAISSNENKFLNAVQTILLSSQNQNQQQQQKTTSTTSKKKNPQQQQVEEENQQEEEIIETLKLFLRFTSAISSYSFILALSIAVHYYYYSERSNNTSNNTNDQLKAVSTLVSATTSRPFAVANHKAVNIHTLRGSVSDASRRVFSSSSSSSQKDNNNNNFSPVLVFKTCLDVLIAAADAGKLEEMRLLSTVLDGIASSCADKFVSSSSSKNEEENPTTLLKDAAEIFAALGQFANVGSPRLRGLVSAWNAPTLPAKKEASVVVGGPFKIDVSPEFEVKHVALSI